MTVAHAASRRAIHGPRNKDKLTNGVMHTLPLQDVLRDQKTGPDGEYPPARVISSIAPVVVRQNDPAGPQYQEALGYTFLLNAPKYPGLCRMDDGTLVLTLTAALSGEVIVQNERTFIDENTRTDVILYSKDDGLSWSKPRRIPGYRTTPMSLGGKRLMLRGWSSELDGRIYNGHEAVFSHDNGRTWDWERRYILFRGTHGSQHSPQSVLLSDERVLTVVMHPMSYRWADEETKGNMIALSNVSAVMWRPMV